MCCCLQNQVESYAFDRVQKWMVSRESGVFAFAVDGADELLTVQSDDAGEIERAVQKCVAAVLEREKERFEGTAAGGRGAGAGSRGAGAAASAESAPTSASVRVGSAKSL